MGIVRAAVAVSLVLSAGACGKRQGQDNSDPAVTEFHDRYDREQYQLIWNGSYRDFQRAVSASEFAAKMGKIHSKLGEVESANQVASQNLEVFDKTYKIVTSETDFESGKFTETFKFIKVNNQFVLFNYDIQPSPLD